MERKKNRIASVRKVRNGEKSLSPGVVPGDDFRRVGAGGASAKDGMAGIGGIDKSGEERVE